MRIDGTSSRARVSSRGKSGATRGSGIAFRPAASSAGSVASGVGPVMHGAGIEAILALQGVDAAGEGRRKALRHGHKLLDTLEEMKADLLVGKIGEGRLNRLMSLVSNARQQVDPDVEKLIDEIDLLAQVELAKLGRFIA